MLETYFLAPKMLAHLRNGRSGSFIDGFAQSLERSGYRPAIAVRYLRAAAHLGHFVCEQGGTLADINLAAFHEHLRTCRCPRAKGGRRNHHTTFGAKNFLNFLQQIGVHRTNATPAIQSPEPALVVSFQHWLRKHRGAAEPTIRQYARGATRLMMALGTDPTGWNATAVRRYFLERTGQGGKSSVEKLITSLRVFLRYLAVQGLC